MTTFYSEELECYVCGKTSTQTSVGSTNVFGSPDLDGRPPEMQRSTMGAWVQRCPSCGYCSADISEGKPGTRELVESDSYKNQLGDPGYPKLANMFLCFSILEEGAGNIVSVVQLQINASWACDDAGAGSSARECRLKAAAFLEQVRDSGMKMHPDEPGLDEAILVDLLRRAGQHEKARSRCREALEQGYTDTVGGVLEFENELITQQDVAPHTIAEALEKGV